MPFQTLSDAQPHCRRASAGVRYDTGGSGDACLDGAQKKLYSHYFVIVSAICCIFALLRQALPQA